MLSTIGVLQQRAQRAQRSFTTGALHSRLEFYNLEWSAEVDEFIDSTLEQYAMPSGYCEGERVRSKILHNNINPGDEGVVVGRCSSQLKDAATRVLVDFGSKGKVNYIAEKQLDLVRLPGGFRIGDNITSLISFKSKNAEIFPGDKGVVSGEYDGSDSKNKLTKVKLDMGGKGPWCLDATSEIQLVRLVGGFRSGDNVRLLISHNSIQAGDQGVVVGPCSTNAEDAGFRVLADFGINGRSNVISSDLKLVRLAGGYRVGDRVISESGPLGVVVGPCSDAFKQTAAVSVSVDFGSQGKIDCAIQDLRPEKQEIAQAAQGEFEAAMAEDEDAFKVLLAQSVDVCLSYCLLTQRRPSERSCSHTALSAACCWHWQQA